MTKVSEMYVVWLPHRRAYISGDVCWSSNLQEAKVFDSLYEAGYQGKLYSYPTLTGLEPENYQVNKVGIHLVGEWT